jgi:hypothetical protein
MSTTRRASTTDFVRDSTVVYRVTENEELLERGLDALLEATGKLLLTLLLESRRGVRVL